MLLFLVVVGSNDIVPGTRDEALSFCSDVSEPGGLLLAHGVLRVVGQHEAEAGLLMVITPRAQVLFRLLLDRRWLVSNPDRRFGLHERPVGLVIVGCGDLFCVVLSSTHEVFISCFICFAQLILSLFPVHLVGGVGVGSWLLLLLLGILFDEGVPSALEELSAVSRPIPRDLLVVSVLARGWNFLRLFSDLSDKVAEFVLREAPVVLLWLHAFVGNIFLRRKVALDAPAVFVLVDFVHFSDGHGSLYVSCTLAFQN